ncbi:hypothetical protein BT63DRAFT_458021 [Microthyrium microscopicum]|uniref:Uncharacterized protein n=1 Tax=Microthyrium microscopicum TaxID=703497 RepID=A0A6A6U439_9PEZI|nr:hypothetical protein BT63DRAFT_458021 [Microthyrium microscopicum]
MRVLSTSRHHVSSKHNATNRPSRHLVSFLSNRKQASNRPGYARPNCTHISMDLIYGKNICDVCRKSPSMGWVYECQQDRLQSLLVSDGKLAASPDESSQILAELRELGFSRSILAQASQGLYSDHQLKTLKRQKINVNQVIRRAIASNVASELDDESVSTDVTTKRHHLAASKPETGTTRPQVDAKCHLKCCHNCRPYYRDRIYASINGIVQNLDAAYARTPLQELKLLNPEVVRHLGLEKEKSTMQRVNEENSPTTSSTISTYPPSSEESNIWTQPDHLQPNRQSRQQPFIDVAQLPPPTSPPPKDTNEHRNTSSSSLFDLFRGLTRSASQRLPNRMKFSRWPSTKKAHSSIDVSSFSTIPLSDIDGTRLDSLNSLDLPSLESDRTVDHDLSLSDSFPLGKVSFESSALEPENALSEIAVEEHVPDIITQA